MNEFCYSEKKYMYFYEFYDRCVAITIKIISYEDFF